eukprot:299533_1
MSLSVSVRGNWNCSSCRTINKCWRLKCRTCEGKRFINNNHYTRVVNVLQAQYKNIDKSKINQLLYAIQFQHSKPQLLSFMIDAYHLIRYMQLLENRLCFQNPTQFIESYPLCYEAIINQCKPNVEFGDVGTFFTGIYDQCFEQFGNPISLNPHIKIKDNMSSFISYIFGMNDAI